MPDYATKQDLTDAIASVRDDIRDTEDRLRDEFTGALRYEMSRHDQHLSSQDDHLEDQDRRINWTLGLLVTLLLTVIGGLILVALTR